MYTYPARRIPSQGKGTGSDHMTVDFICLFCCFETRVVGELNLKL